MDTSICSSGCVPDTKEDSFYYDKVNKDFINEMLKDSNDIDSIVTFLGGYITWCTDHEEDMQEDTYNINVLNTMQSYFKSKQQVDTNVVVFTVVHVMVALALAALIILAGQLLI